MSKNTRVELGGEITGFVTGQPRSDTVLRAHPSLELGRKSDRGLTGS